MLASRGSTILKPSSIYLPRYAGFHSVDGVSSGEDFEESFEDELQVRAILGCFNISEVPCSFFKVSRLLKFVKLVSRGWKMPLPSKVENSNGSSLSLDLNFPSHLFLTSLLDQSSRKLLKHSSRVMDELFHEHITLLNVKVSTVVGVRDIERHRATISLARKILQASIVACAQNQSRYEQTLASVLCVIKAFKIRAAGW